MSTRTDEAVERGLDRLVALTNEIADHQKAMAKAGRERRRLMLRLNRGPGRVSYRRIADVVGLATSRVISEMQKARDEAGLVDEPHPGWARTNGHGKH